MMKRWRKAPEGFTIMELVVSLVLMTVTMTTFMSVSSTTNRISLHHAFLTQALTVGEQVTEELLMMGANHASLTAGSHSRYFDRLGRDTSASGAVYTVTWTISDYNAVPDITQIDVTIAWNSGGEDRQVSWTTYRK